MTSPLKEACVSGIGLMTGKECSVTLLPSSEKGIRFFLQGKEKPVNACLSNVISTDNCTVLGNIDPTAILVEHFMAACAFANMDSLDVHLTSNELPILEGNALDWFNIFKKLNLQDNNKIMEPIEPIELKSPVYYQNGKASIAILPSDKLAITYMVDFDHPDLKNRWTTFMPGEEASDREILSARTFGYLKDLEKFRSMGLAQGVNMKNTLGLTEDGYTSTLNSQYEPIKHKILDLIGDFNLLPLNPLGLKAHIIAKEAGHKSHVETAITLLNYLK